MSSLPIWGNLILLAVAAVVIWRAGTRLEHRVDQITRRTGLGQAFGGMLLLAPAASLPELATTISAVAIHDNPTLGVHNLLGGVALQTALLVLADAVARKRGGITSLQPRFGVLLQAVGLLLLLQLAIASATAEGAPAIGPISAWSVLLVVTHVMMSYLVHHHRQNPRWEPTGTDARTAAKANAETAAGDGDGEGDGEEEHTPKAISTRGMWLRFAGEAAVVLVAGWAASGAADALADQTGLGSEFMGATLLALATSLPEVSTVSSAARHGRYTTAISNIFGSNAYDVTLLFIADILYFEGSILAHAESSVVFIAAIASAMTCVYLWGLLMHPKRTVGRIGLDSAVALVVYITGVIVLYIAW